MTHLCLKALHRGHCLQKDAEDLEKVPRDKEHDQRTGWALTSAWVRGGYRASHPMQEPH